MRVWICKYSKRFLRQKFFLLLLIIMPVGILFFASLIRQEDTSIRAGLVWQEKSMMGSRIGENLLKHPGVVRFYRMDSDEEMRRAISRGEIECGYSFAADMDKKYRDRQYEDVVTQYFRKGSILYTVAGEVVTTGIFREQAEKIAADYIYNSGLFHTQFITPEEISRSYQKNLKDQTTFSFTYHDTGKVSRKMGDYLVAPIRGCVALLILMAGFCGIALYRQDEDREIPAAVHAITQAKLSLLSVSVPVALITAAGIVSEFFCGFGFLSVKEIAYLLIYDIMVVLFCNLLSHTGIRQGGLWIFALGYICACAVMTPVFINLSALLPGLSLFSFLWLPGYFLEAVFGGGKELVQMMLLLFALLSANLIRYRILAGFFARVSTAAFRNGGAK